MSKSKEGAENAESRPVLITGGAGFIGSNLANKLLSLGQTVMILDNLSRPGVEQNLNWLKAAYPDRVSIRVADIRDAAAVREAVARSKEVFHFAAQVAVTTSLTDPVYDFESNLRGTLNVLEAIRLREDPAPLLFTSTNKVYGALEDVSLRKNGTRYEPTDPSVRDRGIPENRPVDFHSPYGCSKGGADQYVIDYARIYGLQAVVFRMSCIYGPRQFGTEDQGWIANFIIRALQKKPITLYGDGMQVRDILFIDDLLEAFLLARKQMRKISGQAFNIGGGPGNTLSLIELLRLIGEMTRQPPETGFDRWRSGDQKYYVTDFRKFTTATGWMPKTGVREGVGKLFQWLLDLRATQTFQSRIGIA